MITVGVINMLPSIWTSLKLQASTLPFFNGFFSFDFNILIIIIIMITVVGVINMSTALLVLILERKTFEYDRII